MVRVTGAKPAADIVTAQDLISTARAATTVVDAIPVVDPQVAALEKYLILADKGITMLGQLQGLLDRFQGLRGQTTPETPPPAPVTRIPYVEEMDIPENAEVTDMSPIKSIGAKEISQVLDMLLSQQPELTVSQLKQLIDANPDVIDHMLHVYMSGSVEGK